MEKPGFHNGMTMWLAGSGTRITGHTGWPKAQNPGGHRDRLQPLATMTSRRSHAAPDLPEPDLPEPERQKEQTTASRERIDQPSASPRPA